MASLNRTGATARLRIEANGFSADLELGESVAVNGCCLSVEQRDDAGFTVFASEETLLRSTAGQWREGRELNLERSLRLGDRLGGHLVAGHVDGLGVVERLSEKRGRDWDLVCRLGADLAAECVRKGSVAIDGVSLTIASLEGDRVTVSVIPDTMRRTNLRSLHTGDSVNIETDMIGKYVARHLETLGRPPDGGLTMDRLTELGY